MAKIPEVGFEAPDFTLPSLTIVDGTPVRGTATLSQARGNPVVLAFYPGDETTVCTRQLTSYTSDLDVFTKVNATIWGISPQDIDSHENFALNHQLGMPLLADTERAVIEAYGIGAPGIGLRRSIFVVDPNGLVTWKHVGVVGATFPKAATIAAAIGGKRSFFSRLRRAA